MGNGTGTLEGGELPPDGAAPTTEESKTSESTESSTPETKKHEEEKTPDPPEKPPEQTQKQVEKPKETKKEPKKEPQKEQPPKDTKKQQRPEASEPPAPPKGDKISKSIQDHASDFEDEVVHEVFQEVAQNQAVAEATRANLFELLVYYHCGDSDTDELIRKSIKSEEFVANARDDSGNTLLLVAAQYGHFDLVDILLHKRDANVNASNAMGATALHFACCTDNYNLKLVQSLLEKGANVYAVDEEHGCTALHYAAGVQNGEELLKLLIQYGARAKAADKDGYTPEDYAAEGNMQGNIAILQKAGDGDAEATNEMFFQMQESDSSDDDMEPFDSLLAELEDGYSNATGKSLRMVDDSDSSSDEADEETHEFPKGNLGGTVKASTKESAKPAPKPPSPKAKAADAPSKPEVVTKTVVVMQPSKEQLTRHNTKLWKKTALLEGQRRVTQKLQKKTVWGELMKQSLYKRMKDKFALLEKSEEKKVSDLMRENAMLKKQLTTASGTAGEVGEMQASLLKVNTKLNDAMKDLHTTQHELEEAKTENEDLKLQTKSLNSQLEATKSEGAASASAAKAASDAAAAEKLAKVEERLKQAKEKNKSQSEELLKVKHELNNLQQQNADLKVQNAAALAEAAAAKEAEMAEHEASRQADLENMRSEQRRIEKAAEAAIAKLESEHSALKQQHDQVKADRDGLKAGQAAALEKEISRINAQKSKEMEDVRKEHAKIAKDAKKEKDKLLKQFMKEQQLRKKFYNELEDLKGKIRVYCRVRPLNKKEKKAEYHDCTTCTRDEISVLKEGKKYKFAFDSVFAPGSTQEAVFKDTKRLMQSALDGYNVCIFAYGQTGSGKTFTMSGEASMGPEWIGITPRAVAEIFRLMERDAAKFDFEVKLSMYELYKDALVDLLQKKRKSPPKLGIKTDKRGRVFIENGEYVEVASADDMLKMLDKGMSTRHVSATAMNAVSSRSHLVQIITVVSTNKLNGRTISGKLTLVDLAGSERAAKTGASGETMKEAQSINKSLSALGNVIAALTTGSKHIPYRDSTLTEVLRDCLGGNAKTLMFVNCGPANYNASETKSSLDFAKRCKNVVNNATAGVDTAELRKLKAQLAKMKKKMGNAPGAGGGAEGGGGGLKSRKPKMKKKK